MSQSIVVGTDGSETASRAVSEAVRLARALDAELHIVSAFDPMRGAGMAAALAGAGAIALPEAELRDGGVESALSAAAAAARSAEVRVTTHAIRGIPADALVEVATAVGAGLIVVGNRGMHGVKRVLGSVPNSVSHTARCNVLIVSTDDR